MKVTKRTLKTLSQDIWELFSIHIKNIYTWEQIINLHWAQCPARNMPVQIEIVGIVPSGLWYGTVGQGLVHLGGLIYKEVFVVCKEMPQGFYKHTRFVRPCVALLTAACFCFEVGSPILQAGTKLTVQPRMTLHFWSSYLHPQESEFDADPKHC